MTEALPPIQAKAAGPRPQGPGGAAPEADVHAVAERGIAGPGGPLPHLDTIQRAFGRHDVGHVRAHADGRASEAARGIGAEAFAAGDHVAFDGAPSLHTAAHEAAHVVQQRAGVQLKGGVGQEGDAYEQHADAVADRVVRGESAEALLDEHAGAGRGEGGAPAIQRKPSDFRTAFGGHKQLNLSPVAQLRNPSWNAYVLNIRPYFKLDDEDQERQASSLYPTCSRERSLREDAERELLKEEEEERDRWKIFSPEQLQLSTQIAAQLEHEKSEVFGDSIGRLDTKQNVRKFGVKDTDIAHGGKGYVGHEDPGQWLCQLFTQAPTMADVQQGNLGDCYLLAAMASIVQRDPGHFVRHMKDNVDGTVTVKLYSAVNTPLQVTVEKTVVGDKYAQNVLWVKLLEKAYVASGLKTGRIGFGQKNYQDISGGASDMALVHLTGEATQSFALGQGRKKFQQEAPMLLMEAVSGLRKQISEIGEKQDKLQEQIKQKQLVSKEASVEAEQEQIKKHQLEIDALMKEWQAIGAPSQELEELLSRVYVSEKTFVEFMKRHEDNELLKKVVSKAGLEKGSLPGELGSGIYGRDEAAAFGRIQAAIDAKKPITASTKRSIKDLDNPEEMEKGLAGESKVNGLASAHAYSVLDYKPGPKAYTPGDQIMIKLRNPWGKYGRKYEIVQNKVKGVADNQGDGTFWIDLADLVAYFDDLAMIK